MIETIVQRRYVCERSMPDESGVDRSCGSEVVRTEPDDDVSLPDGWYWHDDRTIARCGPPVQLLSCPLHRLFDEVLPL